MCTDNIIINPFCNRAPYGIQKDIPSFPLCSPLLPPFSLPGENAPFPSFTQKRGVGREKGRETTKPHQSPVPRTPRKGIYYTDTYTRTYGSVESTQRPSTGAPNPADFHQPRSHDWGGRGGRSGGTSIRRGGRIVVMPEPLSLCPSAVEGAQGGGAGERRAVNESRHGFAIPSCCLYTRAPSSPTPQQ